MKKFTITEPNENQKEVTLCIRKLDYEDYEESDRVYAGKVASMIRESGKKKLLLRNELEKFLKEQGIWTDVDVKNVDKLKKDIEKLLNELRRGGIKLSRGRELCIETMDKRKEMVKILNKRQIFDDTTIESIAENEKIDYLIFASVVHEDAKNYWDSFEDMKNDKLSQVYRDGSLLATQEIYGINPEFEKTLPENKWLKKYNFIDENLSYTDRKTGEKVDKDGKTIKLLQEEATKELMNINGDIVEETPFIDDYADEVVEVT